MNALILTTALLVPALQDESEPPPSRQIGEHSGSITRLAASPDGSVLVTAAVGEVHAWDVKKDRVLWKSSVTRIPTVALGVGDDLVAYHPGMAMVQLIELETGERRTGVGGTTVTQGSRCLAIDPKDRWVWMGTDRGVMTRVVPGSVDSWSNRAMDNRGVTCVAMDAKGNTLAVGGEDGTVRFVGAKSANRDDKKVIEGHEAAVSAIVMDAKGTLVVSGSVSGDLRVWKYSSAKERHELQEQGATVLRLAVDPKGKFVASGDADGAIKVWDLKKGELLTTLPGEGAVTGLAFVGKGKTLAASGSSAKVTLWDLSEL